MRLALLPLLLAGLALPAPALVPYARTSKTKAGPAQAALAKGRFEFLVQDNEYTFLHLAKAGFSEPWTAYPDGTARKFTRLQFVPGTENTPATLTYTGAE